MKNKIILSLMFLIGIITYNHSQVSSYTFSQSSGTYSSITGTAAHTAAWDQANTSVTIPFTFYYNGVGYTSCNVSTNGFITFGSTTPTATNYTPISSSGAYEGTISACSFDLWSNSTTGGNIIYTTSGSSPNRVFIIQYTNVYRYSYGGPVNFQIRLSESTNVITIMYGSCSEASTTNTTVQIGLRGTANTDYNSRTLAANSAWLNNTTASTANTGSVRMKSTALPATGTTFVWTPNAKIVTSGTLTAFSACANTASTSQSFTVLGYGLSANLVVTAPTGFQVSTDNSTFSTSVTLNQSSGVVASTTIYARMSSLASSPTSGNVACSSTSATTVNVAVSGTVSTNLSAVAISAATAQSICLGSGGTSVSVAETGGGTMTSRQWGRRSTSGGTITNVTGTSTSYTPSSTDFATVGTYYLVCTSTPTCGSAMVSNEVTITINDIPATPGTPTTNSPQCISPGVTLTANGSAPSGEVWYWQTTSTGVATTSFATTYVATTTGTYYIRSKNTTSECWGSAGSAAIVISSVPTTPTLTSPTSAATGVSITPTLTWPAISGATSYDVYIGTTLPGSATANVTTNSYSPSTLLNSTSYSWKIIAKNGCGSSVASSTYTFTTVIANDDSGGAIVLTINSSTTCTTTTTGTSVGATQTLVATVGTADDDVWYKFTSTASSLDFSVSRGTMGDLVWELYNSSLVSLGVIDNYSTSPETASLTGSTIGNVYYIRVYSYAATIGSRGTFTICITTPIQPPTNDNASGAITLIVNDPYITGTNVGATSSTTAPTPSGPSYYGGDVWYKVVVPAGGTVQIRTSALVLTDVVMEVYSGTASALTYITYNDDSLSSVNSMPYLELTGRTVGETVWIRAWDYNGDESGTFKIRATTPVALPIGLLSFTGHNTVDGNSLEWVTASEFNNDYFTLERGLYRDGSVEWIELQHINGAGNSSVMNTYGYFDLDYPDYINYYQLTQTDYDGHSVKYEMISIDNRINKKEVLSMTNLLGQEINESYRGMIIITYVDGSIEKIIK